MSYFLFMSGQIFFSLIQWKNEKKVESWAVYIRGQCDFGRTLITRSRHQRSHQFKAFFFFLDIMIPVSNIKMWERKTTDRTYL